MRRNPALRHPEQGREFPHRQLLGLQEAQDAKAGRFGKGLEAVGRVIHHRIRIERYITGPQAGNPIFRRSGGFGESTCKSERFD